MGLPSAEIVTQRKRTLKPVLLELGLSEKHLVALSKRANVDKVVRRLRLLVDAKVPLKGVVYKMGLSDADFANLLLRHKGKGGLNEARQALFDLMIKTGIPEEKAMDIAKRKTYHQMKIPEKIAFFESIKLDPKVYGVERIPVKYYAPLLTKPLEQIQRGIQRQVLWKIEDDFAASKLDVALPGWRNIRAFYKGKGKKRRFVMRPSRIREQILVLNKKGIPLRIDNILASLGWAENNPRMNGRGKSDYKKILVGSAFDPVLVKKQANERKRRIRQFEDEISRLNEQITQLRDDRGKMSSQIAIDLEEAKLVVEKRRQMVIQRNALLSK